MYTFLGTFPIVLTIHQDVSPLAAVLLSLKTRQRLPNITNVVINTVLLLASLDLALNPLVYNESAVVFSRLGAVYPDAAKITVRYPGSQGPSQEIQVLYREVLTPPTSWKNGPFVSLSEEHDWVNTTKLSSLWPSTDYECKPKYCLTGFSALNLSLDTFTTSDGIFLPYPASPIRFQTFPDSRLGDGTHFSFIASSCITPNFPYQGPHHRQTIRGFDLLANSLLHSTEQPITEDCSTNSSEIASGNATTVNTEPATSLFSRLVPKFMLFLGDFIYADVPIYFGDNDNAYLRLYRRNYASPSFKRIYERLRTFAASLPSCLSHMRCFSYVARLRRS